jgi:hypothetical protein
MHVMYSVAVGMADLANTLAGSLQPKSGLIWRRFVLMSLTCYFCVTFLQV